MSKYDISLHPPCTNAAGSLGFTPDPRRRLDLSRFGAFVTNPISLGPRSPAQAPRWMPYPGGFLLHTGYPNPGLRAGLRSWAPGWARAQLPVWVHLIPSRPGELKGMLARLERMEGVAGVEIGLPPEVDLAAVRSFAGAAAGELPVVLRLPFERATELAGRLAGVLSESGTAAVSLAPPRGVLPGPGGGLIHGRLYGPGVFPLALAAVRALAQAGVPVIGAGGVYRSEDYEAMLRAGAIAVQLDAVLWRGGFFDETGV